MPVRPVAKQQVFPSKLSRWNESVSMTQVLQPQALLGKPKHLGAWIELTQNMNEKKLMGM